MFLLTHILEGGDIDTYEVRDDDGTFMLAICVGVCPRLVTVGRKCVTPKSRNGIAKRNRPSVRASQLMRFINHFIACEFRLS